MPGSTSLPAWQVLLTTLVVKIAVMAALAQADHWRFETTGVIACPSGPRDVHRKSEVGLCG